MSIAAFELNSQACEAGCTSRNHDFEDGNKSSADEDSHGARTEVLRVENTCCPSASADSPLRLRSDANPTTEGEPLVGFLGCTTLNLGVSQTLSRATRIAFYRKPLSSQQMPHYPGTTAEGFES